MIYTEDHRLDIEPFLVLRYLQHRGWKIEELRNQFRRATLAGDDGDDEDPVELFLHTAPTSESNRKEIFFALRTLSDLYGKTVEELSGEIRAIRFDLITSRVPDEYVKNESIQFVVANEYMNNMRDFLTSSATTELSDGARYFQRTKKEAKAYADKCRFGHTFHGSFGFVIESPVGLNDAPQLSVVEEPRPFGRRVVERIVRGLTSYSKAVFTESAQPIAEERGGFSANMCDALADVVEQTKVSRLTFGLVLSPEWRVAPDISQRLQFAVEAKDIELLRDAAKRLRTEAEPRPVTVFGRIKRLQTDGNPADLFEENATREIEINWEDEDGRLVHVRMMVTPADYLSAVEAHKNGDPVFAKGMLVRSGRTWWLENVTDFGTVSFLD